MSRLQTNEYECNYEDAATYDSRSEENDLQSVRFTEKDKENIAASSPYIRQLLENIKLEILQHDEVRNAYKSKEIGLFHLFLRQSMFNTICKWTNEELVKKGKNRIIIEKFVFRFVLFLFVFRLLSLFSFDCWQVKEKNNHKYGVLHTKILPITIGRYASYNRISVKRVNSLFYLH